MTDLTLTDIELGKDSVATQANSDKELIKFERIMEERLSILRSFSILTGSEGLTQEAAAKALGKSKSTILRWKEDPRPRSTRPHTVRSKKDQKRYDLLKEKVFKIREENPSWGRIKIHYEMLMLNFKISVSMVGRMICELIKEKRIKSYFGSFTRSRRPSHPPRDHAIPRPKGLKASKPGEIVQIDTMFVPGELPGTYLFQVNATCRFSKWSCAEVFKNVTAKNAAILLKKVLAKAPFKVQAVQTDQGCEFRGEFEQTCKQLQITFYVNHPHSPKQNAVVERFNRTVREEFYYTKDSQPKYLAVLNRWIDEYIEKFNTKRPYQSLGNIPPMKFLKQLKKSSP